MNCESEERFHCDINHLSTAQVLELTLEILWIIPECWLRLLISTKEPTALASVDPQP
jgi:hypothetical protein